MRTLTAIFVIAFLVCLPITLFAQTNEDEKGDVNNDGTVNILDALTVVNNILGTAPFSDEEFWRADCSSSLGRCDGDSIVNVLDVIKIVNIVLEVDFCGMVDIDGNIYRTVTIGEQVWMAENLKVTHYRNGDPIPNVTDDSVWTNLTTGACCGYDNDTGKVATYGLLYNWYAVVDSRKIAPEGWHVPSDGEWQQLEMHLGMSQSDADAEGERRGTDEGGKMKEVGITHWGSPNAGATNESGFTALSGGIRYRDANFVNWTGMACFWSSTEYQSHNGPHAFDRYLRNDSARITRDCLHKESGFSVRCLRD